MGFNLDNYETVKDRITRFYADHQDGHIETELITKPENMVDFAGFKASVFISGLRIATGHAFEQKGQGVNKDAWVENAETSAIGRALANMDYCGTLRPSREEMSKVGNHGSVDDSIQKILGAQNAGELRLAFEEGWKLFPNSRDVLSATKDQRKIELDL